LLDNTEQMLLVSKIIKPLNTTQKIVVAVPPNAEYEQGVGHWMRVVKKIASQTGAAVDCYVASSSHEKIKAVAKATRPQTNISFKEFNEWDDFLMLAGAVKADDLLIVISARRATISYAPVLDKIPNKLSRHFEQSNF